jgi:hypothetical protein
VSELLLLLFDLEDEVEDVVSAGLSLSKGGCCCCLSLDALGEYKYKDKSMNLDGK